MPVGKRVKLGEFFNSPGLATRTFAESLDGHTVYITTSPFFAIFVMRSHLLSGSWPLFTERERERERERDVRTGGRCEVRNVNTVYHFDHLLVAINNRGEFIESITRHTN